MKKLLRTGLLVINLISCNPINIAGDVVVKEVKRIKSPDNRLDAVLVNTDAGATTVTSCKIFIVKSGKKINADSLQYAVFNCDRFFTVKMQWRKNKQLLISYDKARIFNYTNFWESEDVDNWNYIVDIDLKNDLKDYQLE